MKRLLLVIFLTWTGSSSFSQPVYPYGDIKLEKPSDYKETASLALSAATFLLSTPFAEVDRDRAAALKFLSDWMIGTKDPVFYMQGKAAEISYDKNLFSVYIAAMAKYSLENRSESANPLQVELNASKLVLAYCDEPKNNFKLKKKYRKLLETN